MEKICEELAELLEVDSVQDDEVLTDCWDSLTVLSIIALASEKYNKTLLAKDINASKTIGGLIALMK